METSVWLLFSGFIHGWEHIVLGCSSDSTSLVKQNPEEKPQVCVFADVVRSLCETKKRAQGGAVRTQTGNSFSKSDTKHRP